MTPAQKARYNERWGLPPEACNCHHGSARYCPIHTQADYDAASAAMTVPLSTEQREELRRQIEALRESVHRRLEGLPVWTHRPDPEAAPGSESAKRFETVRPHEVAEAVDAAFADPTFDRGGSVIFNPPALLDALDAGPRSEEELLEAVHAYLWSEPGRGRDIALANLAKAHDVAALRTTEEPSDDPT